MSCIPKANNSSGFVINKFINDNVYGGIGFTDKEFAIINSRTFQRLRRIKQQGLTSFTFPSSDHTRFSHSLGVLYVMGKITDRLFQLGAIDDRKRRLLRYAALLHDIGHYPLSHLTESVYKMRHPTKASILCKDVLENSSFDARPLMRFSKKGRSAYADYSAHHERLGKEVLNKRADIRDILRSDGFNDPEEIGQIITGETRDEIEHQLMHSSVDADRIDYLIRDSAAAGVNYGRIDVDYLIRLMVIGKIELNYGDHTETVDGIGINPKGIHTLEHYLMARYFSYSQVTLHRTTSVFETLAQAIIWKLADAHRIYENYDAIKKIIDKNEFLGFDDSYIWSRLADKTILGNDEAYQCFRDTLIERKKIKILFEEKVIVSKECPISLNNAYLKLKDFIDNSVESIAGILGIPQYKIGYIEQELSVDSSVKQIQTDDAKQAEASRIIKNGKCVLLADYSSSLIKELFNKKLCIFRIYYIDPYPYDKIKSDQVKMKARSEIIQKLNLAKEA